MLAFRQAVPLSLGTRLCFRLTSYITAQQLPAGPVAKMPHGSRFLRLPRPLPLASSCQLGVPVDFSLTPQTQRGPDKAQHLPLNCFLFLGPHLGDSHPTSQQSLDLTSSSSSHLQWSRLLGNATSKQLCSTPTAAALV